MQYQSRINATEIVSESEIFKLYPDYDARLEESDPDRLQNILFEFGLDIEKPIERQDGLQHRNRFNEVVVCSRWVGQSRLDEDWLKSGMASCEAKDKARSSRLLDDLYRQKGMTE